MSLVIAVDLLCAMMYGVLALLLGIHSRRHWLSIVLVAACATTAAWAMAMAVEPSGADGQRMGVAFLETSRVSIWVVFLGLACSAGLTRDEPRDLWLMSHSSWLLGILLVGSELCANIASTDTSANLLTNAALSLRLALATVGLLFVLMLSRQGGNDGSWRVRYLCAGVGGFLAYELFLASETILMQRVDPILAGSRTLVSALAAPLITFGLARNPDWSVQLNLSRRAVLDSIALICIGGYLLILGGVGMLLPALGGSWGPPLQVAFFVGALFLLAAIIGAGNPRSAMNRTLSRYLFTHRHDYREQWQQFSESIASPTRGENLRTRAFGAVAAIVDCNEGGLWLRESGELIRAAGRGLPEDIDSDALGDAFLAALDMRRNEILEIDNCERAGRLGRAAWLPDWLREWERAWLIIPLTHRDELIGFIVLGHKQAPVLDTEDEDLLHTVALHVASALAEEHNARALEEARRFEALTRGLAFVAHDIRNVANEFSLIFSNAKKHIHNPDFQRDMLQSMEESIGRLQRLMDRVGTRAKEERRVVLLDFGQVLAESLRVRFESSPSIRLEVEEDAPMMVLSDADSLVAICGHLIQNAVDATEGGGEVIVRLQRRGEMARVEVEDDGTGMSREFLQERLLRPFGSSKAQGFGLGLFECREIARELGGRFEIESQPGVGTTARVWLPLAEHGSDDSLQELRHAHG